MKKEILLGTFLASIFILSIFLWLGIQTINDFYDPYSYLGILLILVFDLALLSLIIFLFDSPAIFLATLILPFSYLIVWGVNQSLVLASLVAVGAVFIAIAFTNLDKKTSIKINFLSISYGSNKYLCWAFTVLMTGLLYSSITTINVLSVPRFLFDKVLEHSKVAINQSIGFFDLNLPIDDFLAHQMVTDKQPLDFSIISSNLVEKFTLLGILSGQMIDFDYIKDEKLLTQVKGELVQNIKNNRSQEIKANRLELSKSFNLGVLKGSELTGDVLYDIVNNYVLNIGKKYPKLMPLGLTISGLILFLGIFRFISLISGFIGLGLFYLLKLTKLVKIESIDIKKEVIKFIS